MTTGSVPREGVEQIGERHSGDEGQEYRVQELEHRDTNRDRHDPECVGSRKPHSPTMREAASGVKGTGGIPPSADRDREAAGGGAAILTGLSSGRAPRAADAGGRTAV